MPIDPLDSGDAAHSTRHSPASPSSEGDAASRPASSGVAPIVLPERLVIATRGDWREDLGARADAAIGRVASEGGAEIALDLDATVEVDVSGLGLLVVVRKWAHDRGVAVRLLHPSPSIRELLALTRLDALFLFDD